MNHLFDSPMSMLCDGLPLDHDLTIANHREFIVMMYGGLVTLELRPGQDGYFLILTKKGFEWYKDSLLRMWKKLVDPAEELEISHSTEEQSAPHETLLRFKDLDVGRRFSIVIGKTAHKLKFRKINDAEEDNAETDSETPELCAFPEDQFVLPASR